MFYTIYFAVFLVFNAIFDYFCKYKVLLFSIKMSDFFVYSLDTTNTHLSVFCFYLFSIHL